MNLQHLSNLFPTADIEWRIGRSGESNGKIWATCFAYVNNRAIMERLDTVCSPENWKNEFDPWTVGDDHGVRCGISIKIGDEWVTKYDGAQPTNMEPIKGGFSDSMKRAAVQWGIGRYLYNLEEGFATIVQKGAKDARYATTKEKIAFYWIPPALPAWAVDVADATNKHDEPPKKREEVDKCSTGNIVKINDLCKETGTDMKKLYEHFGVATVPTKEQAQKMIVSLEKKLSDQIDSTK
jgi:hypothetical protein